MVDLYIKSVKIGDTKTELLFIVYLLAKLKSRINSTRKQKIYFSSKIPTLSVSSQALDHSRVQGLSRQ
jgi:hypothetical protein